MRPSTFCGIYDHQAHADRIGQLTNKSLEHLGPLGASNRSASNNKDAENRSVIFQKILNKARQCVSERIDGKSNLELDDDVARDVLKTLTENSEFHPFLLSIDLTNQSNPDTPLSALFALEHLANKFDEYARDARPGLLARVEQMRKSVNGDIERYLEMVTLAEHTFGAYLNAPASHDEMAAQGEVMLDLWVNPEYEKLLSKAGFEKPLDGTPLEDLICQYSQLLGIKDYCDEIMEPQRSFAQTQSAGRQHAAEQRTAARLAELDERLAELDELDRDTEICLGFINSFHPMISRFDFNNLHDKSRFDELKLTMIEALRDNELSHLFSTAGIMFPINVSTVHGIIEVFEAFTNFALDRISHANVLRQTLACELGGGLKSEVQHLAIR